MNILILESRLQLDRAILWVYAVINEGEQAFRWIHVSPLRMGKYLQSFCDELTNLCQAHFRHIESDVNGSDLVQLN